MIALLLRYWHLAAIALLVALLGVQQVRVDGLKADLAGEQKAASDLRADRERVAREHESALREKEQQHAAAQTKLEKTYADTIKALEDQRRADSVAAGRMRDIIAAYAASGDLRGGQVDAAAIERAVDRLQTLGGLLAEGAGLVIEGRGIVQRRDAEVARLLDQIRIDRAACSPQTAQRLQ